MKKIGIITHYNVHNHGAVLQLYALSKVLKGLGYEADALRFNKNYDFLDNDVANKKYNISIRSIPFYLKYLFQKGLRKTLFNIKKRKSLEGFKRRENLVGEFYSTATNISAVVIGSDEIFSIEAGPNPWFFGMGVPCNKQISYAASFGPTTLEQIAQHNMTSLIKAGLDNLKYISVRDFNSQQVVKCLVNRDAQIVCDPVLLFGDFQRIDSSEISTFKKKNKNKYCIVYSYDENMNDNATVETIRKYAKDHGFKVYSVGYYHKWCDRNIICDPLDIFLWFSCSEFVFTDTFHGSVISLVTNAQFVSKIRKNGNKLEYLLEQYGVKERITDDFNVDHLNKIDYIEINKTILDLRKKSLLFLKTSLEKLLEE